MLLAPPAFLLGPLAGLLAFSHPTTLREWAWLVVGAGWLASWLIQPGDVPEQGLRAAGVLVTGSFLAWSLAAPGPLFRRAIRALGVAFLALALWCMALQVGWGQLKLAVARDVARAFADLATQAESAGRGDASGFIRQMADAAPGWAALTPALLFLDALAGVVLAWALYSRIAARPLGGPAAPFRSFRFSDQLIWLPVAGLALLLAPVTPALQDVGGNLLLVAVALYAARGLAVVAAAAGRLPRAATVLLALLALFLLPFVIGGLTLLGVADTWLDFRRRLASSATGGYDR